MNKSKSDEEKWERCSKIMKSKRKGIGQKCKNTIITVDNICSTFTPY